MGTLLRASYILIKSLFEAAGTAHAEATRHLDRIDEDLQRYDGHINDPASHPTPADTYVTFGDLDEFRLHMERVIDEKLYWTADKNHTHGGQDADERRSS